VGLFGAGHLLFYPEAVPFLVLAFVGYHLICWRREGLPWRELLPVVGVGAAVCAVCLRGYLLDVVGFFREQQGAGLSAETASKFPYFLVPTGLANLWGLLPLVVTLPEPWVSAGIWVGFLLLLALAAAAVWLAWRRHAAAVMVLIMLALAALLFTRQSGFGLFKLSMFIQPFLVASLVTAWFRLCGGKTSRAVPLWLLAGVCLLTQTGEVESSRSLDFTSNMVEIPRASSTHLLSQFQSAIRSLPEGQLILGTDNFVLARFQALYTQGRPALFTASNFLAKSCPVGATEDIIPSWTDKAATLALCHAVEERCAKENFDLHDPDDPDASNRFARIRLGEVASAPRTYLVAEGAQLTVLNRWRPWTAGAGPFRVQPLEEVSNHLCFVESDLGQVYYLGHQDRIGLYRPEQDVMVPERNMAGTGRHQLFEVLNPSATVRLVLDVTSTLKADGENRLPPAVVIGQTRERFDFVGRGAGRVISSPLKPQTIAGRHYLAVDMGVNGTTFTTSRTGLQNLYGSHIEADRRSVVCFARDISVISEEEYARLTPPSKIAKFPDGLLNPQLEYSGVCEDGWVSSDSYFYLTQESAHRRLLVHGMVPFVPGNPHFTTELRVLVAGQEAIRERLGVGEFRLLANLPPGMGRRRVDLHFSKDQRLLPPDSRPMAALLSKVGFQHELDELTADNDNEGGQ
jgi:hypothetical protein